MLPRTDILINRIRQESDTVDVNSISDLVMTNYLNDGQRTIQNLILQADHANDVFTGRAIITAVPSQIEYDLPADVYAESSIVDVWSLGSNNSINQRYSKQAFGQRSTAFGYATENRKMSFNRSLSNNVLVRYNLRLPLMGDRVGAIESISGQVITISGSTFTEGITATEEYISVVDKYGNAVADQLYLDSALGLTLTVEGDITALLAGHYVIAGKFATSHSCLPEECETYLKTFVKRKVFAHINSTKLANGNVFSEEERSDLEELFADRHSDVEYPAITDYDYLDY